MDHHEFLIKSAMQKQSMGAMGGLTRRSLPWIAGGLGALNLGYHGYNYLANRKTGPTPPIPIHPAPPPPVRNPVRARQSLISELEKNRGLR